MNTKAIKKFLPNGAAQFKVNPLYDLTIDASELSFAQICELAKFFVSTGNFHDAQYFISDATRDVPTEAVEKIVETLVRERFASEMIPKEIFENLDWYQATILPLEQVCHYGDFHPIKVRVPVENEEGDVYFQSFLIETESVPFDVILDWITSFGKQKLIHAVRIYKDHTGKNLLDSKRFVEEYLGIERKQS